MSHSTARSFLVPVILTSLLVISCKKGKKEEKGVLPAEMKAPVAKEPDATMKRVAGMKKPLKKFPEKAPVERKEPKSTLRPYEKALAFESDGMKIPGTLALPQKANGPVPAVILIHGSGPQNRDEHIVQAGYTFVPFKELSDVLVKAGYAVYRYDKRSFVIRPKLKKLIKAKKKLKIDELLQTLTQKQFMKDAQAAVQMVKKQAGVDAKRIILVGHSHAGLYMETLDRALSPSAIVLIAPEILPFKEHLLAQARLQFEQVKKSEAKLKGSGLYGISKPKIEKQKKMYQKLIKAYETAFKQMKEGTFPKKGKVLGLSLEEFNKTDVLSQKLPQKYVALKPPVLYINGKNDWICPVSAVERYKKQLAAKKNLKVVILEDCNHLMYTNTPIAFSEQLAKAVTGWLKSAVPPTK